MYISSPKGVMTMEDFKRWILRFDSNGDGKISREELRKAIKDSGGWFASWKSSHAIKYADLNHNGFIDNDEIANLVQFCEKQFGLKVVVVPN